MRRPAQSTPVLITTATGYGARMTEPHDLPDEADEADVYEQYRSLEDEEGATVPTESMEAPEADAFEQAQELPEDEAEYD